MGIDKKSLIVAAAIAGFVAGTSSNSAFAGDKNAKSENNSKKEKHKCSAGKCGDKMKKKECKEKSKGEKCEKSAKGSEKKCGGANGCGK